MTDEKLQIALYECNHFQQICFTASSVAIAKQLITAEQNRRATLSQDVDMVGEVLERIKQSSEKIAWTVLPEYSQPKKAIEQSIEFAIVSLEATKKPKSRPNKTGNNLEYAVCGLKFDLDWAEEDEDGLIAVVPEAVDIVLCALEAYQPKNPCVWCKAEYTIIDDDFGQPLHPNMVKHCFKCGRALRGEANG